MRGFILSLGLMVLASTAHAEVIWTVIDSNTIQKEDTEAGIEQLQRSDVLAIRSESNVRQAEARTKKQAISLRKTARVDVIQARFQELIDEQKDIIEEESDLQDECNEAIDKMDELEIANSMIIVPTGALDEDGQVAVGY